MLPEQRGSTERARRRGDRNLGGRHRAEPQMSAAGRMLRTTGAVTALVGTGLAVSAMPAGAATADDFARLRQCESGGNYAINTGNGFYGAYQFDITTWQGLGYAGRPDQAPPALQDQAAYKLYDNRGWAPWPSCSAQLGLGNTGPAPTSNATQTQTQQATAPAATPTMSLAQATAALKSPGFDKTVLTSSLVGQVRPDAYVWQDAMVKKGFVLKVDGRFGAQSQGVASLYSFLTNVSDGQTGAVGPKLWDITVGDAV